MFPQQYPCRNAVWSDPASSGMCSWCKWAFKGFKSGLNGGPKVRLKCFRRFGPRNLGEGLTESEMETFASSLKYDEEGKISHEDFLSIVFNEKMK